MDQDKKQEFSRWSNAGEVLIRRVTVSNERYGNPRAPEYINFTFAEYAERGAASGERWFGLSRADLAALHTLARDPRAGVVLDTAALCAVTIGLQLDPVRGRDGRWRLPADDALMIVPFGWLDFAKVNAIDRALTRRKPVCLPATRVWKDAALRSLGDAAARMEAAR